MLKEFRNLKPNFDIFYKNKSGREVLPTEVQIGLYALDTLHLKDFKMYGTISKTGDIQIYQRMCESAYPILFDTNSKNIIGRTNELSTVAGLNYLFTYNNISIAKSN
jgi:hypothetical protein